MRRPDPVTAVLALVLVMCVLAGLALAASLERPRIHGPDPVPPNAIRCWGWYEGTTAGREGEPCPSSWPLSDRDTESLESVRVSTGR